MRPAAETAEDPAGPGTDAGRPGRSRGVPADVAARLTDGTYAVTTNAVAHLKRGVTAQRIRDWNRRDTIDVDVVRRPDGTAVRVRGRRGWENVWDMRQLRAADEKVRSSGRGAPRKRTDVTADFPDMTDRQV